MEDTDLPVRIMFPAVVHQKVQEQAAVLSPGKGDKNIVEFFKKKLQTVLQRVIYIQVGIFSYHLCLYSLRAMVNFQNMTFFYLLP